MSLPTRVKFFPLPAPGFFAAEQHNGPERVWRCQHRHQSRDEASRCAPRPTHTFDVRIIVDTEHHTVTGLTSRIVEGQGVGFGPPLIEKDGDGFAIDRVLARARQQIVAKGREPARGDG